MAQPTSRFLIGIDLGTSNCALYYIDQNELIQELSHFPIAQWIDVGELATQDTLPSHFYILTDEEVASNQFQAPWQSTTSPFLVGAWARTQQTLKPGRNISSAKSWLCFHSVDPFAKMLPQTEDMSIERYSPVEVTTSLIQHICFAWNAEKALSDPTARLEDQQVVLTVPASFDEAAREYTAEAVKAAGLKHFTLLEEPQAAFYSWIASAEKETLANFNQESVILVVDVGGGTMDFSLVKMTPRPDHPVPDFERIAVSDHILLGGDNIDLTLAHEVETRFGQGSTRMTSRMWDSLVAQCSKAKESLLSENGSTHQIVLSKSGSRLVGKTSSHTLHRDDILEKIFEGFFPIISWSDAEVQSRSHGLRQVGLPYAQEAAITKHLGTFLKRFQQSHPGSFQFPDRVLFNGGTLAPELLQQRLLTQLVQWRVEIAEHDTKEQTAVSIMASHNMHLAVARGATYFHLAKRGQGVQISGGSARSYYVGLSVSQATAEETRPAWLCVLPQQANVDEVLELSQLDFLLAINQPVQFKLISSVHRPEDQFGDLIHPTTDEMDSDFVVLPAIHTFIAVERQFVKKKAKEIQVGLKAQLNEIGTLSLYCVNAEHNREWKLEFRLRESKTEAASSVQEGATASAPAPSEEMSELQDIWEGVENLLRPLYSKRPRTQTKDAPKSFSLYKLLEKEINQPRIEWAPTVLRKIWDTMIEGATYRVRSIPHELNWIKVIGYCLRPGFGFAEDEWRIRKLETILKEGAHFRKERAIEIEWWIMLRRAAGGLSAGAQSSLLQMAERRLTRTSTKPKPGSQKRGSAKKRQTQPQFDPRQFTELWRLVASLEDIPPTEKVKWGERLFENLKRNRVSGAEGWCIARLGARRPLYGHPTHTIPPSVAESWVGRLLEHPEWLSTKELPMVLVQLVQKTDDRARDVGTAARDRVMDFLKTQNDAEDLEKMLLEGAPTSSETEASSAHNTWLYGDSLPMGLKLKVE